MHNAIEPEKNKTHKTYKITQFANVVQIKDLVSVADNVYVLMSFRQRAERDVD